MKWLRLLAALIALLAHAVAAGAAQPAISEGRLLLRGDDTLLAQPLALGGNWHYFPDRWVAPRELADSIAQASWARVPDGRTSHPFGIGTYWLQIIVDSAIAEPSTLQFQHICGAATVYLLRANQGDAAPILTAGKLGRDAVSERPSGENLIANIPPLQPGIYNLLIQHSNFHLRGGGLCGGVTWGAADVQMHARILDIIKNAIIATMLLSLGLGSLMLGSQNGERAAPWLALMCISCATLIAFNSGLLGIVLPANSHWQGRLDYLGIFLALIWLPLSLLMVFHHTFAIALPRWLEVANIAIATLFTAGIVSAMTFFTQHPFPLVITLCAQMCLAFGVLAIACLRGRQYAWFAAFASALLLMATLYDCYRFFAQGLVEILIPYAIAFLAAVHGGIYTLKFGASYQLAARLSAHLQEEVDLRTRELREKNYSLEQTQNALQRANETLRELSITDGLTRVYNRMYFEQQFDKEWRRCSRQALPLSVLMIDADHFKQLNDSAGHLIGDLCLQSIAQEILTHFKRSGEVVARYGGEEFIVLLPDTNQSRALAAAEGLRAAIERLSFTSDDGTCYRVTISIGVSTTVPGLDLRPEQLIATADAALYEAKDAGRNRVHSIPIIASRTTMAQQKLHL